MNRLGCIYIIKNIINDKVYIGQTSIGVANRWKQHIKPSNIKKNNYALYRAMTKYGVENFYYEILEDGIPIDKLDEKEIYYIQKYDSYKNGYNSTKGGDGRVINKIEDMEYIINKIKQGVEIYQIAKELNVSATTINRAAKAYGINYRLSSLKPSSYYSEKSKKISRDEIRKYKNQGLSHAEIGNIMGINSRTVSRIVKELGLNTRNIINYNNIDCELILREYELNVFNGNIGKMNFIKQHGLNQGSIEMIEEIYKQELESKNVELKDSKIQYLYIKEDIDNVLKLVNSGHIFSEIANIYNVPVSTIRYLLMETKYRIDINVYADRIKEMINEGLSNNEISDILNISKKLISDVYKNMGIKRSRTPYQHRNDINEKEMKNDYILGMSIKDICDKYDIDKKTFAFFKSVDFNYYQESKRNLI